MRGKILVVYNDEIGDEFTFIEKNKMLIDAAKKFNIALTFRSNTQLYTYIDNDESLNEKFGY